MREPGAAGTSAGRNRRPKYSRQRAWKTTSSGSGGGGDGHKDVCCSLAQGSPIPGVLAAVRKTTSALIICQLPLTPTAADSSFGSHPPSEPRRLPSLVSHESFQLSGIFGCFLYPGFQFGQPDWGYVCLVTININMDVIFYDKRKLKFNIKGFREEPLKGSMVICIKIIGI